MKLKNEDVIALVQIQQFLLDPPHSFRLHNESVIQLNKAMDILKKYPEIPAAAVKNIEDLTLALGSLKTERIKMLPYLLKAGKVIAGLTNK